MSYKKVYNISEVDSLTPIIPVPGNPNLVIVDRDVSPSTKNAYYMPNHSVFGQNPASNPVQNPFRNPTTGKGANPFDFNNNIF